MEIEISPIAECKNCAHYSAYYENSSGCYYRKLQIGFCGKQLKQKRQIDYCDSFENLIRTKVCRREKLLSALEKSLNSINCIAEALSKDEK